VESIASSASVALWFIEKIAALTTAGGNDERATRDQVLREVRELRAEVRRLRGAAAATDVAGSD
jgi:hypothetical protein